MLADSYVWARSQYAILKLVFRAAYERGGVFCCVGFELQHTSAALGYFKMPRAAKVVESHKRIE